ncbi:MAG: hypothetical protein LBI77_03605 [Puniceicoccales bacterium]|jgi:hypothetical protein|nr:hypothetical protein [Puniceicoccales bacterium]
MDINAYDINIDAQAIEIFSNGVIAIVTADSEIAKKFETLTEIERNNVIHSLMEHRDMPNQSGRCIYSLYDDFGMVNGAVIFKYLRSGFLSKRRPILYKFTAFNIHKNKNDSL